MSDKKTFSVAALGIPEQEQRVLRNIFKLSLYRPHAYMLTAADHTQPVDILIVDADDTQALTAWRSFRSHNSGTAAVPTVMVTQQQPTSTHPYCIRRPFVATRILSILDQVALKELRYIPEIVIGASTEPSASEMDALKQAVQETAQQPQYTALIVDDSRPVRKQIELELELFGIQSDMAETGEQALDLLDRKTYDIIFLDVVLPGVDGYKICKTIKKDKAAKETPVIMLTGKSSPFDRIRGTFAGCDTYLTKPVAHDSFHKVIKKYLR